MLVVEREADEQPDHEPPSLVAQQRPNERQEDRRGQQLVEGGRQEQMARHQREEGGRDSGGQDLGATTAPQLAGEECGQDGRGRKRQGPREAQGPQLVPEDLAGEAGKQRGSRRLVHVSPLGLLAEQAEVQLISVVPVRTRRGDDHCRDHCCHRGHGPPGHGRTTHGRPHHASCCPRPPARLFLTGTIRKIARTKYPNTATKGRTNPVRIITT